MKLSKYFKIKKYLKAIYFNVISLKALIPCHIKQYLNLKKQFV